MSHALHTLLAQAERERDAGLAALARAQNQAQRLQAQAEQLHQYRQDLRLRNPAAQGQTAAIDSLRVHQGFSGRLEDVIDQQQAQRLAALAQVNRQRQALLPLELRVASVRKLLGRRAEDQRRVEQQRDQRQTDESAQQQQQRHQNQNQNPNQNQGQGQRPGPAPISAPHATDKP
jgi:flagellar FliJ protein